MKKFISKRTQDIIVELKEEYATTKKVDYLKLLNVVRSIHPRHTLEDIDAMCSDIYNNRLDAFNEPLSNILKVFKNISLLIEKDE